MNKVLIVDDDRTFNLMLKTFLSKNEFEITQAYTAEESLRILKKNDFNLILLDLRLPDKSGLDLLKDIKESAIDTSVILMTSFADIKTAVKAIKMGAFEYITKPINPDELLMHIHNCLIREHGNTDKKTQAPEIQNHYVSGESKVSEKINEYIDLVAPTNMAVLVQGESGTGKEYVSRMIHDKSKRANMPFIAVDCGTLSKDLAASELFGHVKGSFTGALADKNGQFVLANGGTLFLDEIGNLSYDIQIKLLRAIQEKTIRKVGGNKDIKVDVRLITASNEDLAEEVRRGYFREDLYHRLNEFKIEVPPLRERGKDIKGFALYFLEMANKELEKDIQGFDNEVMDKFAVYSWPGNLRELKNVVKRSVLLSIGPTISLRHLPSEMIDLETHMYNRRDFSGNLKAVTEQNEKEMIINTLEKVKYNKSKAARILNIDRKTLYNKLKFYNIDL